MLRVTKVLYLVLAAAISSDAIGGLLFFVKERYLEAIAEADSSIIVEHDSMVQNLKSAMERISSRLDRLEQRDDADNHTILESRTRYATWKAATRKELSSILNEALNRLHNAMDEVETYVVMYKQNRIPEAAAVRFIKEDKNKLPEIVESAKSRFLAVGEIIDNQL